MDDQKPVSTLPAVTPPEPTAEPEPEPVPTPEQLVENVEVPSLDLFGDEEPPEFKEVAPFRSRKMVEVVFGEDYTNPDDPTEVYEAERVFVYEYGLKNMMEMTKKLQVILEKLREHKVINLEPDAAPIPVSQQLSGLISVISECTDDVFTFVERACFRDWKHTVPVKKDDLEEYSPGMVAMLLRAIWTVNWDKGFLKKALAGIGRRRMPKPKIH